MTQEVPFKDRPKIAVDKDEHVVITATLTERRDERWHELMSELVRRSSYGHAARESDAEVRLTIGENQDLRQALEWLVSTVTQTDEAKQQEKESREERQRTLNEEAERWWQDYLSSTDRGSVRHVADSVPSSQRQWGGRGR